jgi:hypothetical protein
MSGYFFRLALLLGTCVLGVFLWSGHGSKAYAQITCGSALESETAVVVTVVGETGGEPAGSPKSAPVTSGTVRIPELGLAATIENGCAEFQDITLPRNPMLLSFEITAEGYRPSTWANYLVMAQGQQANFTPTLHLGSEPEHIDPCPDLIANAPSRSAAEQQHAQLCADLLGVTLPGTGAGAGETGTPYWPWLAALAGVALVALGAARVRRCT